MPLAKASVLDWFTGRVTEDAPVTEQVTCIFLNYLSGQHDCFTDDQRFKCSAADVCAVQVSGKNGEILRWKSSCGGEVSTIIDGTDQTVEFKCQESQTPIALPVAGTIEQVKCNFINSNSLQKCHTTDGKFSCTGVKDCSFQVSGEKGAALSWRSSCEGTAATVIDGADENLEFTCQPTPACTDSDGGKNYQLRGTARNLYQYENTDYCNSEERLIEYFCQDQGNGQEIVYTETHGCDYGCRDGACLPMPAPVCGNGICDNEDEKTSCAQDCTKLIRCNADSDCGQTTALKYCGPKHMPIERRYPDSYYACKSGGCTCVKPGTYDSGCQCLTESCIPCTEGCREGDCLTSSTPPAIKEPIQDTPAGCTDSDSGRNYWTKGYIKTTAGGNAEDVCENHGYLNEYYCVVDGLYSDRIMCPYGCTEGACRKALVKIEECMDSDQTQILSVSNGVLHPPGEDRYVKGRVSYGSTDYEDYCVKISHYADSAGNENIRYEKNYEGTGVIEEGCLDGKVPYETHNFECPEGCRDGACIREKITEEIRCTFSDSDTEQQCYAAESFTAADEGTRFCRGIESCVINYSDYKGKQINWKSTCGGYQYTVQDGKNQEIRFECKAGETNLAEIKNKGFRFAYWQCYDGSESRSEDGTSCKASETWQKYASEFCRNRCYKDNSKCGVNSFSVGNECYAEAAAASPAIQSTPVEATSTQGAPTQGMLYYFRDDGCPHCKDMDNEIGKLKQKGFFSDFGAVVYNIKDPGMSQKFDINAVPTLILYKDACSFRKEGFMNSEEIEGWAYNASCPEKIGETDEATTEPILVCKDSCPTDGKCYPFGYRKSGKFCSDEGHFISQSESDKACDNNFECSSNVCVDSKCMSSGFIKQILDWFRKLFG